MRTEIRTREDKIPIVASGLGPQARTKSVCDRNSISPSTYRRWRKEILESAPRLTPGTAIEKNEFDGRRATRYRAINYQYATLAMLNPVAYQLCRVTDGVKTIRELAQSLVNQYENVELARATEDAALFFEKLKKHKLVYYAGEDPPPILETTSAFHPQEVWLNVTNACNLRCITCFKAAGASYRSEMPLEMLLDVVNQIHDLGIGFIVVSGGEPFIRRDTIKVIERIVAYGIRTLVITNGTFITKELASRLAEIDVWRVQVSLDGSRPEINDQIRGQGSFYKAIHGAKLLLEQGIDVRFYPTVTRLNIDDLPNIKKLIQELRPGFNRLSFAKFYATGRGKEHGEELDIPEEEFYDRLASLNLGDSSCTREYRPPDEDGDEDLTPLLPTRIPYGARKVNCGLGSVTFSIDADGKVYPCHWLHDPDWCAGNLHEQSLASIYHGSQTFKRCRSLRVDHAMDTCNSCDFKYFCGGGCRARAMGKGGDLWGCDPACTWMHRYFDKAFWTDFDWGDAART